MVGFLHRPMFGSPWLVTETCLQLSDHVFQVFQHSVLLPSPTLPLWEVHVQMYSNIGRRHSIKRAPLIDWDLILVMEPSTILGAVIGGYLNKVGHDYHSLCLTALDPAHQPAP